MKTKVRVRLTAATSVEIEVEHAEGEDPCDLTDVERNEAIDQAYQDGGLPSWDIDRVEEVQP